MTVLSLSGFVKMKMRKILNQQFLLWMIAFLIFNCSGDDGDRTYSNNILNGFYATLINTHFHNTKTTSFFQDNKDGTITFTTKIDYVNREGTVSIETKKYRKCLEGQVFRSDLNDCMGLGDSTSYFNAQTYQYCNQNNLSCNQTIKEDGSILINSFLTGSGNSEVYTACSRHNNQTETWKATAKTPTDHPEFKNFFPSYESELEYWSTNSLGLSNIEKAYYNNGTDFKVSKKYVLCYSEIN